MLDALPIDVTMALLGGVCGIILGLTARLGRFCTFSAIEDHQVGEDGRRLRSWALAIAVAVLGTQMLQFAGYVDLSTAVFLVTIFPVLSLIVGGLSFGFGMAMVGTCGFGSLVRLSGGDLKSLVNLLVMGFFAYTTMRGLIGMGRLYGLDSVNYMFAANGEQALPALLGVWLPSTTALAISLILVMGIILIWCFGNRDFRTSRKPILTGLIMGLTVTAGWFITGYIGNDDFDPQAVQSLGYVRPSSEFLVYIMTWSGASVTFGIGSVMGVLVGGFAGTLIKREWHWEGFDDVREMKRHLIGAALMGFGGITMMGCTIGQGISGLSTLSIGSFLAMGSLYIGATLGLHYVLEGSISEAFVAIKYRFFVRD